MKLSKQLPYLIIFIILVGVGGVLYYQNLPKEMIRYNFYGTELEFRDDLRSAQNITVYPNEESILNKVWNPEITKINIAYVLTPEASDENSMIALNAFEIRYKLDIAYRNPNFNWANEFTSTELSSYDNITQTDDTLTIALVRPSLSDSTGVELDGNVAYIKGKTPKEFDLATIKFIMSALNITV
ncbi:MAG: hypothetical protein AABW61_02790 [Candidatus Aenigmatarchaeota archaeon]